MCIRDRIVPNQAIATYVTQWTYDSHNRLLEMIYPDEEKITYSYNLGGQLEDVYKRQEKGNSVYRQAVENYDVANYYTQGNVTATSVEDANGNKYTETKNRYDSYYLTADGDKYTFAKRDVNLWSDRASAFVPLRYTANLQYEGSANGVVTSEAWNEYYLNGYHGELKSYKYLSLIHI